MARHVGPAAAPTPQEAVGDLRFFRVCMDDEAPAVRRRVRDLDLPHDCILVSIQRAEGTLVPRGDTVLQAGDCVYALGRPECVADLRGVLASAVSVQ